MTNPAFWPPHQSPEQAVHVTHEADDTTLRLAVAKTKIERFMQGSKSCRARDAWQAQAERLALAAPIVATGPSRLPFEGDPHRSWLRCWFGWLAAG